MYDEKRGGGRPGGSGPPIDHMNQEKKILPEELFYTSKNGFDLLSGEELKKVEAYCESYKSFLDNSKTERLCNLHCIRLAEEKGFVPYREGMDLKPGDRIYYDNRGKGLMLAIMGKKSLSEGANISVAHTDSPRYDIKPRPLYEDGEMAYLQTHPYGWAMGYQWVALPLAIHGVVIRADGTSVTVSIGEEEGEPQFIITDLLPHLGREHKKKLLGDAYPSHVMSVLVGSRPLEGLEEGRRFKGNILAALYEKYGIVEEDLISAELDMVPVGKARDIGFDRSLFAAYGLDDPVCVYAELAALFDQEVPEKTAVCLLADKEEVNSDGVTGMKSMDFEYFMGSLCRSQGVDLYGCYAKSLCISADVEAAYDPSYKEVFELQNVARVNHGVAVMKFTGSCGDKSDASDASAEVVGTVRRILNQGGVLWQLAMMGKPEAGGGGTVAKFMANRNIDTIDAGVPVLSMHAPFETVSKIDCYMTYRAVSEVYRNHVD